LPSLNEWVLVVRSKMGLAVGCRCVQMPGLTVPSKGVWMQSVVSGVVAVMMVIDLHKGVWWEEEREREREAGGRLWMRHCMGPKQSKRGAKQTLPDWKIEWQTLLAARVRFRWPT